MTRLAKAGVLFLLCRPALAAAAVGRVEAVEGLACQMEVGEQPGKVTSLDTRRMGDDFGAFVKRNGGLKKP
ncbi:MAG TPA: hypothetical protein VE153_03360 [Myxococcus sp.]|nr:hypothetical protein [Myxococcus sp.]